MRMPLFVQERIIVAEIVGTTNVPQRTLTIVERKATNTEPESVDNLSVIALRMSYNQAHIILAHARIYICPKSTSIDTLVNDKRITLKTPINSGDIITIGNESGDHRSRRIRLTFESNAVIDEVLSLFPIGQTGSLFDDRVIQFDKRRQIVTGKREQQFCRSDNGFFDATTLFATHATFHHNHQGVYLSDESSLSGTFVLRFGRSTRVYATQRIKVSTCYIIQFGSAINKSKLGFIQCAVTIGPMSR